MSFGTLGYTGAGWTLNPGLSTLTVPAALGATGTLEVLCRGFTPGVTYYAMTLTFPASYDAGATPGAFLELSASFIGARGLTKPLWNNGGGQQSLSVTISFAAEGILGEVMNQSNPVQVSLQRIDGAPPATPSTWAIAVQPVHEITVTGNTNPGSGGQAPPDTLTLIIAPGSTVQASQSQQIDLSAACFFDVSGGFPPNQNFTVTVMTAGLGTLPGGATTVTVPNNPSSASMPNQMFTVAPTFIGLGQIRCETNAGAPNSPRYYTINVVTSAPASGPGDFNPCSVAFP